MLVEDLIKAEPPHQPVKSGNFHHEQRAFSCQLEDGLERVERIADVFEGMTAWYQIGAIRESGAELALFNRRANDCDRWIRAILFTPGPNWVDSYSAPSTVLEALEQMKIIASDVQSAFETSRTGDPLQEGDEMTSAGPSGG